MKNENYIVIQGFMINELKLKGNELIIYAIIYGFSQVAGNTFNGSLKYLEITTNLDKTNVIRIIKKLIEKKLLIKNIKYKNNIKYCQYTAVYKETKYIPTKKEKINKKLEEFNEINYDWLNER